MDWLGGGRISSPMSKRIRAVWAQCRGILGKAPSRAMPSDTSWPSSDSDEMTKNEKRAFVP